MEARDGKETASRTTHIDALLHVHRAEDLEQVHGLLDPGVGEERRGVGGASNDGNDLASSAMDRVGMELQERVREVSSTRGATGKDGEIRRTVTSRILTQIPRIASSITAPSFVAHWKAATAESLISPMCCRGEARDRQQMKRRS